VWSAIIEQVDCPNSQSEFVSVNDSPRVLFAKHPWSIGGGGAAELKVRIDEAASQLLSDVLGQAGFMAIPGEDEAFVAPKHYWRNRKIATRPFAVGDNVRDWSVDPEEHIPFMYDGSSNALRVLPLERLGLLGRCLWPYRENLRNRLMFGKLPAEAGLTWYELRFFATGRFLAPARIVFPEVATHNHFVFDSGRCLFKHSVQVIDVPSTCDRKVALGICGILNSSTGGFWLKQVCHNKGSTVDQHGARQRTSPFEDFFAFNGTKLQKAPLPAALPHDAVARLIELSRQRSENTPATAIVRWHDQSGPELIREQSLQQCLDDAYIVSTLIQGEMLLVQEDLDWECYRLYGLIDEDLTVRLSPDDEDRSIPPANRAFEIVLARKMAAGEAQSTWFERHGMTPNTELPDPGYSAKYREIVARRIEVIESNPEIALIEQPEYKRRWNWEPWESQKERALREWLLNRLESYFDFDGRINDDGQPTAEVEVGLISVAKLADIADHDPNFHQVGATLQGDMAFDIPRLVAQLVEAESVPLLPILRYKASGLRKRAEWETTWELQRREDELAAQRVQARQRMQAAKERVASSLTADKADIDARRQALWDDLKNVRERFAPDFPIPDTDDPSIAASMLGQHGVSSRAALEALEEHRKQYVAKAREFDSKVYELCKSDAGYQAAVRELESIPEDPEIAVPPKYTSADFQKSDYWRLRGKLDVPKERWVSFPHCEGPDGTLMIAWAGYDHLQLARAISAYFVDVKERLGGADDPRLVPLLACLIELLPWLKQWHNEPDAAFDGLRMGDYFEGFVTEEARALGKTIPELKAWTPPARTARRTRRTSS
jgi:hypothetical protein